MLTITAFTAAAVLVLQPPPDASVGGERTHPSEAADPAWSAERDWSLRVTPYLWIPAQSGDVTVQGTRGDVGLSIGHTFDTITDSFNFGLTLHAEYRRADWTVFADVMYLSLETDDVPLGADTGTVRQDTGVFELGVARRMIDRPRADGRIGLSVEPFVALRAHYLSIDIEPSASPAIDGDQFWVDAVVGARVAFEVNDRVTLLARGDVGAGESDFTWSALAGAEFSVTERLSLQLGYRALDTDYDDGHGADRFAYDLLLHGPYAALSLDF